MKFKIFSELTYEVYAPTTFIFNIHAAKTAGQTIIEESFQVTPPILYESFYLNNTEARFIRMDIKLYPIFLSM